MRDEVTIPNIIGMTISEAEKKLKEYGIEIYLEDTNEELNIDSTIITNQVPQEGITVYKNSYVYINY